MLTLNNIQLSFGPKKVLNNITVAANDKSLISILGHNGAGKSTLLSLLTGHLHAQKGSIFLGNREITRLSVVERSSIMAIVHQDPKQGTIGDLTVAENGALALLKNKGVSLKKGLSIFETSVLKEKIVGLFGQDILNQPMKRLSGGQRQLISFLMATAKKPNIVLLDEPTAALDPTATNKMISLIQEYQTGENAIILLISHDIEMALALSTHLWLLKDGAVTVLEKNDTTPAAIKAALK